MWTRDRGGDGVEERLVVRLAGVAPESVVSLGKVREGVASLVLGSMK